MTVKQETYSCTELSIITVGGGCCCVVARSNKTLDSS
jgi:hypothetical protein